MIKKIVQESFLVKHIDLFAFGLLVLLLISAIFTDSSFMGTISIAFSFLMIFKIIFNKTNFSLENHEKALIIYFLIVCVSLAGSTLFSLSLHGFLKTLTYILFYFSCAYYFEDNKNKIFQLIILTSCLMTFEAFVALWQNYSGVQAISGWQDMTNINPEDVIARAYGTLKPYNPNLLAGYLIAGLWTFVYLAYYFFKKEKLIFGLFSIALFLLNLTAVIQTGCRGAYLGLLLFFPALFVGIVKSFGGLSKISAKYKNVFLLATCAFLCFVFSNSAIIKRFQSIFSLRADSSISFRLNVYESVWRMFLDNIF
ncbi:hypothetical protein IJ670_05135, partial [bacterium]|nr:hypothetical protein [bacterium]